jgi:hypothetical protein
MMKGPPEMTGQNTKPTAGYSSFDSLVKALCKKSRTRDGAVIGPLVTYPAATPDAIAWCAIVAASHRPAWIVRRAGFGPTPRRRGSLAAIVGRSRAP